MAKLGQVLEKLTRARLLELAEQLEIAGLTGKKKDEIVSKALCKRFLSC